MKKMHEQMERLYQAARERGVLQGAADQATLSRVLNIAQQNVNNWESRGVSKEGLLEAQLKIGVNATWVMTGSGPMFVGGESLTDAPRAQTWPFGLPFARYERLNAFQKARLSGMVEGMILAWEGEDPAKKSA